MILFILQNAYKSTKHQFENEEEWSTELVKSHTGRRLKEMIPEGAEYKIINSSNEIGNHPDSSYPADLKHIRGYVDATMPVVICACGKIAQQGCEELGLKFVYAPHPAWRRLSKLESNRVKEEITRSSIMRMEKIQNV